MPNYPPRDLIVSYLKNVLYGPLGGVDEQFEGTPFLRYMTGILFPRGKGVGQGLENVSASADEESKEQPEMGDEGGGASTDVMEMAFEALPSAVGISFRVKDDASIRCRAWGATYLRQATSGKETGRRGGRARQVWKRQVLADPERSNIVEIRKGTGEFNIFGDIARIVTRWRSQTDGSAVVTVTLVNNQRSTSRGLDPEKTLFQVGIRCESRENVFMPYQEAMESHQTSSEDAEISFLYKESVPFARGHGSAATWGGEVPGKCDWVETDFIPTAEVPYATFDIPGRDYEARCLGLEFIDTASRGDVLQALGTLVNAYGKWVDRQVVVAKRYPAEWKREVAIRLAERSSGWLRRMKIGLALLGSNDIAWDAFRTANKAMGWQMALMANQRSGPYPVSARRTVPGISMGAARWRPFQIAFFLSVIESLVNEDSRDREVVDVIWFPTGGGKTEAYLLITAFEVVRRRLVHGENDKGTAVFSRYTLRLLTADQFQRTGVLIAALELSRKRDPERLGRRPFSLGLWVGLGLTPNTFRNAHDIFQNQLESNTPRNTFQLLACPACGTEIFPSAPRKQGNIWNSDDFGVVTSQDSFRFRCPNPACDFSDGIPLNIVDEALYRDPPTMILGTMDKFAQLPWDERGRSFFWGPEDDSVPPTLILQDELHLVSGPLGSLSAPYEAAIDAISSRRGNKTRPKRIASTATIRNAPEQVRGLYGRNAAVFPAPCGRWDDAYFFKSDRDRPGRLYAGVMGQGYTKPVVAMAWTVAALLQSVEEVKLDPDSLDAYWTLLAYHNSRRELGRTLTAARDEVTARIKTIASSFARSRVVGEPLELSARMVSSMSEALAALRRPNRSGSPAIDLVPCTSIISVGVDVDRLGVMLVNGQPKLTSEYIQATSRIGRGKVPGLVVTLFSPSKPRDRSHYEDFRAFHESIHRHVEPTSVTPYALPARERTLHAAIVSLVRHSLPWKGVDEAGKVDFTDGEVTEALETLLQYMRESDPTEAKAIVQLANKIVKEWQEFAEANPNLLYENRRAGVQFPALLCAFGGPRANCLWPTMTSVRSVDEETRITLDVGQGDAR